MGGDYMCSCQLLPTSTMGAEYMPDYTKLHVYSSRVLMTDLRCYNNKLLQVKHKLLHMSLYSRVHVQPSPNIAFHYATCRARLAQLGAGPVLVRARVAGEAGGLALGRTVLARAARGTLCGIGLGKQRDRIAKIEWRWPDWTSCRQVRLKAAFIRHSSQEYEYTGYREGGR